VALAGLLRRLIGHHPSGDGASRKAPP
jgi:hypothetical protein